ncbi:MAG: hypothetical protein E7425_07300 [Ruminococcaceae bacterium]|nr:hypothetical protein [Oscillospiraceae bacterium]
MKRTRTVLIIAIMLALLLFFLTSCGAPQAEPTTPNTYLPSVMYDGSLYLSTFKQISGEVDSLAIVGKVSSTVPLSQLPTENGQANFEALDAPYAITDEGLAVLVDSEWILFSTDASADGHLINPDGTISPTTIDEIDLIIHERNRAILDGDTEKAEQLQQKLIEAGAVPGN